MRTYSRSTCTVAILGLLSFPLLVRAGEVPRVLFFSDPQRSDNHVIRRSKPDVLSTAEQHFLQMTRGIFKVTVSQDAKIFTPANLKRYDAVVFFAALNPPIDKKALLDWVNNGGAFLGIHSTANTFRNHPPFIKMLGAKFRSRPWRSRKTPLVKARILVKDSEHPATKHLGKSFEITDDIYLFGSYDLKEIHVLLSLDRSSLDMTKVKHKVDAMPIAWTKVYGKGRVMYTALGDPEAVWKDPRYQSHLIGGLKWLIKRP